MDKLLFCAHCQNETTHTLTLNTVNKAEIIARCSVCGREVKFPAVPDEELTKLFTTHREENQGQRPLSPVKQPVVAPETKTAVEPVSEDMGPRVQANLTPQEQAAWDQLQANSPVPAPEENTDAAQSADSTPSDPA